MSVNLEVRSRVAANIHKYFTFCFVGATGLVVDMTILWVLHSQSAWSLAMEKLIAAETALLNNFVWNEMLTFKQDGDPRGSRWSRLFRFHAVCLIGICLSSGILLICVNEMKWPIWLANGVAIVISSIWNFALSLVWAWRNPGQKAGTMRRI